MPLRASSSTSAPRNRSSPTAPTARPRSCSTASGSSRRPPARRRPNGPAAPRSDRVRTSRCAGSPSWRTSRPTTSGSRRKRAGAKSRRSARRAEMSVASTARPASEDAAGRAVAAVWRIESAKIIATLTRTVGDFALAEDLAQDAVAEALATWPAADVPANPAAWLTAVAKRRAIDGWRRRERYDERIAAIAHDLEREQADAADADPWDPDAIDDD